MFTLKKIFLFVLILVLIPVISYSGNAVSIFDTTGQPRGLKFADDGSISVNLEDQTTRPFDIRMFRMVKTGLTLTKPTSINSYGLNLSPGHGVTTDDSIAVIEENSTGSVHLSYGEVLAVVDNLVSIDTPFPYSFSTNATVFTYSTALNVDGSGSPQEFSITNVFDIPVDITRFIFHITDASDMDDGLFGGLSALTKGIVLRKKDASGIYTNYWNIKTNGEFGELAYDKTYDAKAPSGVYGLTCRLTYSGQEKHGVTIRLEQNDSIQLLVQDNLTGLLSFTLMVQGHFTDE